jgi:hypothetical protein
VANGGWCPTIARTFRRMRRGLDYGRQGFSRWDLTREVLKAIERE